MRKYGVECWNIEILEVVIDINLLNEREQYWIAYYDTMNNGYNMNTGGGQNSRHSIETINKMKQIKKTKEQREKMSLSAKRRMSKEKQTGENNRAFKRHYFTPWGVFPCIAEAYESCPSDTKIGKSMIRIYCLNSEKTLIGTNNLKYFSKESVGKTYKELGFYSQEAK